MSKNIQTAIKLGQWFVSISRSHSGNKSLEEFILHEIKQDLKRVTIKKNHLKKKLKNILMILGELYVY